jgi:hypothetical protein
MERMRTREPRAAPTPPPWASRRHGQPRPLELLREECPAARGRLPGDQRTGCALFSARARRQVGCAPRAPGRVTGGSRRRTVRPGTGSHLQRLLTAPLPASALTRLGRCGWRSVIERPGAQAGPLPPFLRAGGARPGPRPEVTGARGTESPAGGRGAGDEASPARSDGRAWDKSGALWLAC